MGKNNWNKEQRMQLKALISWLGLLLIVILLFGQFVMSILDRDKKPGEEVHIPTVETFTNIWIMEADADSVLIFRNGVEEEYSYGVVTETEEEMGSGIQEGATKKTTYSPDVDVREQIADIVLTNGTVTDIQIKSEKINGRILSVDESTVEVEGYGKLPLAQDYQGYRIYNTLTMCDSRDLSIGYNFADLVIEDGEICGILIVKEESMEYIRVLLKKADYAGLLHEQLIVSADTDFTIQYGTHDNLVQEVHSAGDEIAIGMDSGYFVGERVTITPNVLTGKTILKNVSRSHGTPSYRGHIELLRTEDGIAVINQVLLEEYLYCVVPSEMPASYPNEALKAQAICARTYAYGHMLQAGYPQYGAHVDDSTSYQVYNNILEQESTTTAVKETYGQLLYTNKGGLAGTYYYSTSCGVGSDANVWKTNEAASIDYLSGKSINQSKMQEVLNRQREGLTQTDTTQDVATGSEGNSTDSQPLSERLRDEETFRNFIAAKNEDDFEVSEGWYRWTYHVPNVNVERICTVLQSRYQANAKLVLTWDGEEYVSQPVETFETIQNMFIAKRGAGGVADEMVIETECGTYKVISEHNIRYVLNNGETKILRQDGSEVSSPTLLPSAFFAMAVAKEQDAVTGYTLAGGGFGHGVGMSQNGAKQMAQSGYNADEILLFFYDDCAVRNVYEQ
uniref:SpoIID/LytB domain-containing protein n=1 Tax=Acetatifactor sp. TaxID=1872090 RepID=UPI0040575281